MQCPGNDWLMCVGVGHKSDDPAGHCPSYCQLFKTQRLGDCEEWRLLGCYGGWLV
jgi:hypothetical protein